MKKLNRKGFTLVELLAVIIILAIVVGITIPAVLTMVDDAREKAGYDAAAAVADWVDKQYSYELIGLGGVEDIFKAVCLPTATGADRCDDSDGKTITPTSENSDNNSFIIKSGLSPKDISQMEIKIVNDRACVVITAASSGNYYVNRNRAGGPQTYESAICDVQ